MAWLEGTFPWHHHDEASRGDFNADGFDDLAIGSRLEDVAGAKDAGAVNVLYGSPAGLQADSPGDHLWPQGSNGVQDQAEPGDELGRSLGSSD